MNRKSLKADIHNILTSVTISVCTSERDSQERLVIEMTKNDQLCVNFVVISVI